MAVSARAVPELETVSIVLIGRFQIDEFEPSHLFELGCVEAPELTAMKIPLRFPDGLVLHFPSLHLNVEATKVQLSSTVEEPIFERVREFFSSFFGLSKNHDASAMGINSDLHRRVEDTDRWHTIGHRLVPKDAWRSSLKLVDPGLVSVTVQGKREDGENGFIRVRSEPSALLAPGVYVQVNDHFTLKAENAIDDALRIANTHWADCRRRHIDIPAAVFGLS